MQRILPKNLITLANACPKPLYLVGGAVRDFLSGYTLKKPDLDICSPLRAEDFVAIAESQGLIIQAVYRNTGTVKLSDGAGNDYEFSCFRSDKYIRGVHTPVEIYFTDDVEKDARRRDFTANAVYYDIAKNELVDPLGGVQAIKEKRFTTVAPAKKVFGEDGLRLLRLARQSAQLGFVPDDECLQGAKENAALIDDISPERIYAELCALLTADKKYGVVFGHYHGLQILEKTGVFARIFPELALGKGMSQRADFHDHDVLEHSFRAVKYADESVRLAALFHDIGKPACQLTDGNAHAHPSVGKTLTVDVLNRLKAPKRTIERTAELVALHMYDFNCQTGENKLRKFFVEHYALLPQLLLLKQADFSACKDDVSPAPTCVKWRNILDKMQTEHAPVSLKQLAVKGNDLLAAGIPAPQISKILKTLLLHTVCNPQDNVKERLCRIALGLTKS